MICPKCNKEIKDGLNVCDKCGEKLNAKKFKMSDRPHSRRGLVFMTAIIIVIILSITFAFLHQGTKKGPDMALYVKDGEIYMSDFSSGTSKVTSSLLDKCKDTKGALTNLRFSNYAIVSEDSSHLFYPDSILNPRAGFTLYAKNLNNPNIVNQKIATSVLKYFVSDDAKRVTYINTNGSLYTYDVKAKRGEKLSSGVLGYENAMYINGDHSKIYFVDTSNYDLYLKETGKKKEKLDSQISYIANVTGDFNTVYYVKNHTLYKLEHEKEKVEIATGITSFIKGYENGECYYLKKGNDEITFDTPYELNTLCYYDTKEVLLSNGIKSLNEEIVSSFTCGEKVASIVYQALDISVYSSQFPPKDAYYFAKGDKITKLLNHPNVSLYQINEDADKLSSLVYPDDDNNLCDLYMIDIDKNGKATEVFTSNNVSDVMSFFAGEKFVYLKNVNNHVGDLYIDDTFIDDNVYVNNVTLLDSGEIIYYKDYDSKDNEGTLYLYKDSKKEEIAKAVSSYKEISDGSIVYLCDFSQNTNTGSLYRFKDSKSTHLDDGVEFIMSYWE